MFILCGYWIAVNFLSKMYLSRSNNVVDQVGYWRNHMKTDVICLELSGSHLLIIRKIAFLLCENITDSEILDFEQVQAYSVCEIKLAIYNS